MRNARALAGNAAARVSLCLLLVTAIVGCGTKTGAPAAAGVQAGMSTERLQRIDAHFHKLVDDGKIAGVVTWVARHGQVVHEDAYGLADTEAKRAMSKDSYFYVYSMTKPITSVALLMLYEEGRFQLRDPVARYLPELANLKLYGGEGSGGRMVLKDPARQPTIQDVFRHTAGFLYGMGGERGVDKAYREANVMGGTLTDLTQRLGKLPLAYEPGTQWVYSVSHDVQARLVEVLSGMPFDQFVRQRIFEPLGMKHTVFGRPDELKDQFAVIYGANPEGKLTPSGALDAPGAATRVLGGFSVSATAADYGRFARMLVNSGELDGVRILSRKTIDLMDSNHLPPGVARGAAGGGTAGGEGYGLGVRVVLDPAQAGNLTSAKTFGWSGAAGTHFFVDRTEDLVAVFMVQRMGGADGPGMAAQFETLVYQAIVD
jgi:CubicO group peptidase (beta-lactamase class C family)